MNHPIIVAINPDTRKIVTVITETPATAADYTTNHPDVYKLITVDTVIHDILDFFRNAQTAGKILDEIYLNAACTAVLKKPNIAAIKKAQIELLYNICAMKCGEGLTSSVLGTGHTYPTQLLDQQNLQIATLTATHNTDPQWTALIWCSPDGQDAGWNMRPHTAQQVIELNKEYGAFIEKTRIKLRDLVQHVNSLPNEATLKNAEIIRSTFWQ
jgi:hypothetical protein